VLIIFYIENKRYEKPKSLDIGWGYLSAMKHILTLALIAVIIAIAFIVAPSLSNPTGLVIAEDIEVENEQNELPDFRIYTTAVCDNVSGFVVCHDELFASCGGFEYRLPKEKVDGQAIFDEGWEDPRNK